jgi:Protein of unknown function (DUF3237)
MNALTTPSATTSALPAPALQHVLDLTVYVATPIEAGTVVGLNSRGKRRIIPITGGTATGHVNGKVLPGGADFQIVVSETTADLDARYMIELDNGEHIFVQNRALRRGSAADIAKLVRGEAVDASAIYFRCVPTFEVSSPALEWLTQSIFVGTGARYPDRVQLSIFRVA